MHYSSRKVLIVTNNPMVYEANSLHQIIYDDSFTLTDVLICARNKLHSGRKLLTHPLSGSVKPHETPYKTVLLSVANGPLDFDGLEIMEMSIQTAEKFENNKRELPERILKDFQLIDLDLIEEFIK